MATTAAILDILITANATQAKGQLAQVQGGLKKTAATSTSTASVVKKSFAVMGLAALGAGAALYKVGEDFDDAFDKIRTRTGATGKDLKKLEGSFKSVVKSVPTDFDSAATAVAGLNQRLGLTGRPLTRLTKQVTQLAKVTGTDVQENVESVTRLFGDWSVATEDQRKTLNKLYRASEDTGISVSDLSRSMVQFGSPLRQLGIDFDHAAAMFGEFEQAGVNTQTLMPGLRYAIKAFSGGIAATTEDLKKWGVSMDDPQKALQQIMDMIKDAPNNLKANQIAFEVFGQRAGPDMAAAIREGHFELNKLIKVMNEGSDTISKSERSTRDFSEWVTILKNNLEVALLPVAKKVFKGISDLIRDVTKAFKKDGIQGVIDLLLQKLGDAVPKVLNAGKDLAGALVKGFLDAPVLAQLAVGGWLFAKLGGGSALKALGQKIATLIFGAGRGGVLGKLTGTIKPIPVYVVNSGGLPGGGGKPTPTPGPGGGKPTPVPTGPGGGGIRDLPGKAGPLAATLAALVAIPLASAVAGNALDKMLGKGAGAASDAQKKMTDLRYAIKHLADAGKAVPAKMIERAGLDPKVLRDAGVKIVGLDKKVSHLIDHSLINGLAQGGEISRRGIGRILDNLNRLPKGARTKAAEAMVGMAKQLEDKGKLPEGSAKDLRDEILDTYDDLHIKGVDALGKLAKDGGLKMASLRKASKQLKTDTGQDGEQIKNKFSSVLKTVGKTFDDGGKHMDRLRKSSADMKAGVSSNVDGLSTNVGKGLSSLVGFTNQALRAFGVDPIHFSVGKGEPQKKQRGGIIHAAMGTLVPGVGNGDKVPAMLEPGEVVVNKKAVAAMGGASRVNAINSMIPRFASGGVIQQALGPYSIPPIAYDPNHAGGNSHLHLDFFNAAQALSYGHKMQGMGWSIGEYTPTKGNPFHFGPITTQHQSAGHYDGTAFDANTSADETRAQVAAVAKLLNSGVATGAMGAAAKKIAQVVLKGPDGPLKDMGQSALDKVRTAANRFIASRSPKMQTTGMDGVSVDGNVQRVFASVAKKLSTSKVATLALGEAGFAESGMRDLSYGDASSTGALQLLASTAASMGINPHDEGAVASAFLLRGFYGRGGANKLAAQGYPANMVAQLVQGSAFSDGSNYAAQEGPARAWMKRYGLQRGGILKLAKGGGPKATSGPGGGRGSGVSGSIQATLNALARLRGTTSALTTDIAHRELIDAMNSSPSGSELSTLERLGQQNVWQALISNIKLRRRMIGQVLPKLGSSKSAKGLRKQLNLINDPLGGEGSLLWARLGLDALASSDTSQLPDTSSERLSLLSGLLANANARYAVSQAQYGAFAGMATGGPVVNNTLTPSNADVRIYMSAGGEAPSVSVNGQTAKAIVQQGGRGLGKRPLGSARGY